MLAVAIFNFPYAHARAFALALVLMVAVVGLMALTVALTPFIIAALPVVGKLLFGGLVIAGYAWWFKP